MKQSAIYVTISNMKSIGEEISKSIKENKWLYIKYKNKGNIETKFWCAVTDINFQSKRLKVTMFNESKSYDAIDNCPIFFNNIVEAQTIEFSSFDTPLALINKIEENPLDSEWLNYNKFKHNVLDYYSEASRLDNDPYQKEYTNISGIDEDELRKKKKYNLSNQQMSQIIRDIYHDDLKKTLTLRTLAISILSIDNGKKKYLVLYYQLTFNPKKRTLEIKGNPQINKTFLINKIKYDISDYTEIDCDDFYRGITHPATFLQYKQLLEVHLKPGEKISQEPEMMLLERTFPVDLEPLFDIVNEKYENNSLPVPLKAFFGSVSKNNFKQRKEPSLVLYDERANANQIRALYNCMKYPLTYVQGPPGTGKTQTILNVVLSAFFNQKVSLVCSSNNKPVDGIIEKFNFKYKNNDIILPYLRLGNHNEVIKATETIKKLYQYESYLKPNDKLITKIKMTNDEKNNTLILLLKEYEKQLNLNEYLDAINKLESGFSDKNFKTYRNFQLEKDKILSQLNESKPITDEMIRSLFTPACKNEKFSEYLYFDSLKHILKLKLPKFKELIDICYIQEEKTRISSFNNWIGDDNNMELLTEVFPIIFTTNISACRLGTGRFMFDLVIMDESGQCNPAQALIPIARANSLLMVGDQKQLKPVIVLDDEVNKKLKEKYTIGDDYDYKNNSIMDVMINHDSITKLIVLKYHYRCAKKIINFSNMFFYDKILKLENSSEGSVEFLSVKNINKSERNAQIEEANAVVDYIERNKLSDVFIVTPFINEKELINTLIKEKGLKNISCGTIHTTQGAERDTVIFSCSVSPKTSEQTYKWISDHQELINVALTRAKNKFVFVGDKEAIDLLDKANTPLKALMNYCIGNGKFSVSPQSYISYDKGKSNGSENEKEFFYTLSQFCSVHKRFIIRQNVDIAKLFPKDFSKDCRNYEFDDVLYAKYMFKEVPFIIFEIDGPEHYKDIKKQLYDKNKMEICKKNNIKLIHIDNSFTKCYEYIKSLIKDYGKDTDQMDLFEDF